MQNLSVTCLGTSIFLTYVYIYIYIYTYDFLISLIFFIDMIYSYINNMLKHKIKRNGNRKMLFFDFVHKVFCSLDEVHAKGTNVVVKW